MAGMFDPQINATTAQSLFDIMGPGSAGQYLGSQQMMQEEMNGINQNLSLADLDKITLANQHDRTMNPMKEQVQRAAVREADSKTPEYFTGIRQGELGDARTKVAQARLKEGTLDTDIAAGNSKNTSQMIKNMGQDMLQVSAYVGSLPPEARRDATAQLITHHGWDKNPATRAVWEQLLNSPDIVGSATKLAEQLSAFDPANIQTEKTNRSREGMNKEDNVRALQVANIGASATRYSADQRGKDYDKEMELQRLKQRLESRVMELTQKEAVGAATPQEKQERKMLVEYALTLRSMGAPKADVGIPQTNPVGAAMGRMGLNAPPPPNAPIEDIVKYYSQGNK